jgi:hypothetical protein
MTRVKLGHEAGAQRNSNVAKRHVRKEAQVCGKCVGNVWEICGKCVGNVWEMCGKCVGNVWDDDLPSRALVGYSREADSANVYDSQEKKTMFLIHLQQELC